LTTQLSAVLYARKSNEDGGESVDQQLTWGRETAQKEGIEIAAEFVDQAKKGWETAKRTRFHEMLAFCQQSPCSARAAWRGTVLRGRPLVGSSEGVEVFCLVAIRHLPEPGDRILGVTPVATTRPDRTGTSVATQDQANPEAIAHFSSADGLAEDGAQSAFCPGIGSMDGSAVGPTTYLAHAPPIAQGFE
jgi:hypothetical protein